MSYHIILTRILVLTLFTFLGGCIEFEDQEIRWSYLPESDEIVATIRYQGIYGGDGKKKDGEKASGLLTKQEIHQLEDVMKGGRAFFFNNWISEFNQKRMQESLDKLEGVPAETGHRIIQELLASGEVRNVGFYLDRDDRLCGAQTFRLGNISSILGLTNQLVTEKALAEVQGKLDGDGNGTGGGGNIGGGGMFSGTDLKKLLGRLERVKYEQMRMSGIIRLKGKYQIHLENIQEGQSFWLKEGKTNRGFQIVEVNMEEGYAMIVKNAQTAKVHLRSREIEALEGEGDGRALENMQAWIQAIESKEPFIGKTQRGFYLRVPVTEKQWEEANKNDPFPNGMNVGRKNDWLLLDLAQNAGKSGVLEKECFPGYVPNAVEHVQQQYGMKTKQAIDQALANFLGKVR